MALISLTCLDLPLPWICHKGHSYFSRPPPHQGDPVSSYDYSSGQGDSHPKGQLQRKTKIVTGRLAVSSTGTSHVNSAVMLPSEVDSQHRIRRKKLCGFFAP